MLKFTQLDNYTTLSVTGEQSKTFLQSHLTANLNDNLAIQPAAFCNQKGRVIASFWLIRTSDADYTIVIHTPLAEITLKKLNRTAPLSRVKITIETPLKVIGLINSTATLENTFKSFTNATYLQLSNTAAIAIVACNFDLGNYLKGEAILFDTLSTHDFNTHRLKAHWFNLDETSSAQFLPNRLGLLENKAVSVKKGCYIGHEIIARLHFKTEEKYQLYITDTNLNLNTADKVMLDNKDIGEVVEKLSHTPHESLYALSLKKDKIEAFEQSIA